MLCNGGAAFVEQQRNGFLSEPKSFIGIEQLDAIFLVFKLEDEKFGGAVAYVEVLFHRRWLLCEFLVHLEVSIM